MSLSASILLLMLSAVVISPNIPQSSQHWIKNVSFYIMNVFIEISFFPPWKKEGWNGGWRINVKEKRYKSASVSQTKQTQTPARCIFRAFYVSDDVLYVIGASVCKMLSCFLQNVEQQRDRGEKLWFLTPK